MTRGGRRGGDIAGVKRCMVMISCLQQRSYFATLLSGVSQSHWELDVFFVATVFLAPLALAFVQNPITGLAVHRVSG